MVPELFITAISVTEWRITNIQTFVPGKQPGEGFCIPRSSLVGFSEEKHEGVTVVISKEFGRWSESSETTRSIKFCALIDAKKLSEPLKSPLEFGYDLPHILAKKRVPRQKRALRQILLRRDWEKAHRCGPTFGIWRSPNSCWRVQIWDDKMTKNNKFAYPRAKCGTFRSSKDW